MKLVACIVETRNIPDLENIIQRHMGFLPEETDLHIWVGDATKYLAEKFPNATVKFIGEMSIEKYNRLLTSPNFWNLYLDYDKILIFQSDSMILRPGVMEFTGVDYIGASWRWESRFCGNGGFSLRTPLVMKKVCEKFPWDGSVNEDHWICMKMYQNKIGRLAPIELADKFSVEGKAILGSWAYHDIEQWLPEDACNKIKTQYNEK